jgi:hypothetical protein
MTLPLTAGSRIVIKAPIENKAGNNCGFPAARQTKDR